MVCFESDASSARPDGNMEVPQVIRWQHASKAGKCSSAKVHGSIKVAADGTVMLADIGVKP